MYSHQVRWLDDGTYSLEEIYIMADKFCMEALKNDVIVSFKRYCQGYHILINAVTILQQNGYSGSQLIRYLLDQMMLDFV